MVHVGDAEKNVHDSLVIVEHVIADPNFLLSQPRFFSFSSFTVIVIYRWYDYQVAILYSGEQGSSQGI
jgi:hypothetical protein